MGNKVLYIDNVTTYDYVKDYRKNHDVDPSTSYFTYVVFTNYERPNNYGYSYHGDIFFNGKKITYINDVDVTKSVTDGKDNIIAYVNDDGGIGFVSSTIKLGGISNTYELFNVKTSGEISYEYISNLGYATTESLGEWGYEAFPNNIEVANSKITFGDDLTETSYVKLWRESTINSGTNEKTITTYAYCYIYNLSSPESVSFGITPSYFPVGTIYTPRMEISPADAIQSELTFSYNPQSYIKLLNSKTGTFECISPGYVNLTCSYKNNNDEQYNVSHTVYVNKINPHLSLSAYHTTYLYDADGYRDTYCYAHYDVTEGVSINEYTWLLNDDNIGGSNTKSGAITYNMLREKNNDIITVTFSLPEDIFEPNTTKIQLYAPTQEICRTQAITIDNITQNNNVMEFCIVASAVSNGSSYVDTNYVLNNSIGLTDFIIKDIVKSGSYTYTYVMAQTEPSVMNNLYIKSQMTHNDKPNMSNDGYYSYYTYNYINVHTTDSSFINVVKSYEIPIKFQHSELVADPVVMSQDMYVSTQTI